MRTTLTARLAALAAILLLAVAVIGTAWFWSRGGVTVHDRTGEVERASIVDWHGEHWLERSGSGAFSGAPDGDGVVRIYCAGGRHLDHGYVTGGMDTEVTVTSCDPPTVVG